MRYDSALMYSGFGSVTIVLWPIAYLRWLLAALVAFRAAV